MKHLNSRSIDINYVLDSESRMTSNICSELMDEQLICNMTKLKCVHINQS